MRPVFFYLIGGPIAVRSWLTGRPLSRTFADMIIDGRSILDFRQLVVSAVRGPSAEN